LTTLKKLTLLEWSDWLCYANFMQIINQTMFFITRVLISGSMSGGFQKLTNLRWPSFCWFLCDHLSVDAYYY
jgi:hypothetical protein